MLQVFKYYRKYLMLSRIYFNNHTSILINIQSWIILDIIIIQLYLALNNNHIIDKFIIYLVKHDNYSK